MSPAGISMKNNVMLILLSLALALALALAVFGVITTEVAVIGLLPQLTEQLQITAPQVSFLVSIYAVVVAITGPAITLMLGRYNRKTILLVIMAIFIISNIAYAITHQYDVILFFRILPALTHAVFFAIALVGTGITRRRPNAAGKSIRNRPLRVVCCSLISSAASPGMASADRQRVR